MKIQAKSIVFAFLAGLVLAGCSAHNFFYQPTRVLYADPAKRGMPYDLLEIESLNGKKLSAILFKTDQTPKGTVVHFHGNFGNVSCHFMGSQFLTTYGFDVIVFDYQGYGGSEGKATPKNTVEDGIAVVRYAQENLRTPGTGVVVLGQSLGAAVATVSTAKEPLIKAVVLEAPFYSYKSIGRDVTTRSFLLWPLYPFYPLFLGSTYDPARHIAKISPRPVLIIHGDQDRTIPHWMSEKLFEKAKEPKRLWIINGAGHLECRHKEGTIYEKTVADFFTAALQK